MRLVRSRVAECPAAATSAARYIAAAAVRMSTAWAHTHRSVSARVRMSWGRWGRGLKTSWAELPTPQREELDICLYFSTAEHCCCCCPMWMFLYRAGIAGLALSLAHPHCCWKWWWWDGRWGPRRSSHAARPRDVTDVECGRDTYMYVIIHCRTQAGSNPEGKIK